MMMAEETVRDLMRQRSTEEQSLKGETFAVFSESSKATDTQIKRNSSMSEESNNKSQFSDTESMDPGQDDDDDYNDDVEPDSIPFSIGSAFVSDSGRNIEGQNESSTSKASVSEPLTVSQRIREMHDCQRQLEEANFLKTLEEVSILEQKIEMLSLENKDLTQQAKVLKEENSRLRSTPVGVLEDQNKCLEEKVEQLQENLRHAVEMMYYYQSRCEKFELLQADRVVAGPAGPSSSPPPNGKSEEPDTMMPCLQDLVLSHSLDQSSNDKVDETSEEKDGDLERKINYSESI